MRFIAELLKSRYFTFNEISLTRIVMEFQYKLQKYYDCNLDWKRITDYNCNEGGKRNDCRF